VFAPAAAAAGSALLCCAIANAGAWTLGERVVPAIGLVGCLTLAGAVLWQL
jgi:APA family basic amino acid/polyamine antiporter